jgi:Kazal-type serine protease inhibitor domain
MTGAQAHESRVCMMNYAPVCGVDGRSYDNDCTIGDIAIAHIGKCDTDTIPPKNPTMDDLTATDRGMGLIPEDYTNTGKYLIYSNPNVGYSFSLPRYAHYQGMGARDGANHSVAVALTATGTDTWESADVQVWYYKKSPTTPPSPTMVALTS